MTVTLPSKSPELGEVVKTDEGALHAYPKHSNNYIICASYTQRGDLYLHQKGKPRENFCSEAIRVYHEALKQTGE